MRWTSNNLIFFHYRNQPTSKFMKYKAVNIFLSVWNLFKLFYAQAVKTLIWIVSRAPVKVPRLWPMFTKKHNWWNHIFPWPKVFWLQLFSLLVMVLNMLSSCGKVLTITCLKQSANKWHLSTVVVRPGHSTFLGATNGVYKTSN